MLKLRLVRVLRAALFIKEVFIDYRWIFFKAVPPTNRNIRSLRWADFIQFLTWRLLIKTKAQRSVTLDIGNYLKNYLKFIVHCATKWPPPLETFSLSLHSQYSRLRPLTYLNIRCVQLMGKTHFMNPKWRIIQ